MLQAEVDVIRILCLRPIRHRKCLHHNESLDPDDPQLHRVRATVRHFASHADFLEDLKREVGSTKFAEKNLLQAGRNSAGGIVHILAGDQVELDGLLSPLDPTKETIRLLRVPRFDQAMKDCIVLLPGNTSDIDGQIDIERTHVPAIGQQQFRHPTADEDQVVPVKAKDIHNLDQDGLARLDGVHFFCHRAILPELLR